MSDDAATPRPHGAAARARVAGDEPDEAVPKLPRGRGIKLSRAHMARLGATAALLVMVVLIAKPCADTVSSFVTSFGTEGSAAAPMLRPGTVDRPATDRGSASDYETLPDDMTPAQYDAIKARQRAKQAAKGRAQGSANAGSAGPSSGSAPATEPAPATGSAAR